MPILMMWLSLYPFRNLFVVFASFRNKHFGQQPPQKKLSPSIDPFRKSHLSRGCGYKMECPCLSTQRQSKSPYPSFISDTVPYWWRRCSLVLQCFLENFREGEIYVVVGSVLTRMSLDVSVEC